MVQTWIFAANTYGRVAARLAGVPVVVVAEMAVDLWKGRSERFDRPATGTWCDRLVGNSHAVVDFYRELGVPDDRLAMIYSGIDDEPPAVDSRAVRAELGFDAEAPLGLVCRSSGRTEASGRPFEGSRSASARSTRFAYDDRRRRSTATIGLKKRRMPIDLNDRVRFLGHRDDVSRLMAAADIVVLPSAYEGLPNVVLEAMRFGKPVVATAAPGTTEVVVDGETGVLVPVGNVMLLARAIRDLVRDPALARRLGEAGRARVESHFRADAMVAQIRRTV